MRALPAAGGILPAQHSSRLVLPAPLRPDQAHLAPGADHERRLHQGEATTDFDVRSRASSTHSMMAGRKATARPN